MDTFLHFKQKNRELNIEKTREKQKKYDIIEKQGIELFTRISVIFTLTAQTAACWNRTMIIFGNMCSQKKYCSDGARSVFKIQSNTEDRAFGKNTERFSASVDICLGPECSSFSSNFLHPLHKNEFFHLGFLQ